MVFFTTFCCMYEGHTRDPSNVWMRLYFHMELVSVIIKIQSLSQSTHLAFGLSLIHCIWKTISLRCFISYLYVLVDMVTFFFVYILILPGSARKAGLQECWRTMLKDRSMQSMVSESSFAIKHLRLCHQSIGFLLIPSEAFWTKTMQNICRGYCKCSTWLLITIIMVRRLDDSCLWLCLTTKLYYEYCAFNRVILKMHSCFSWILRNLFFLCTAKICTSMVFPFSSFFFNPFF